MIAHTKCGTYIQNGQTCPKCGGSTTYGKKKPFESKGLKKLISLALTLLIK